MTTSRIHQPDTQADEALRACLDVTPTSSFVMIAGAGSGKTTSLVKGLAHLASKKGVGLRRRGQQIACITYTEVAVGEIWGDVGNDPLFQVSTIHSFLWNVVRPFQSDIRSWVTSRIGEKIAAAEERIAKPGTQAATKNRLKEDIDRYVAQIDAVAGISRFTYGTGSSYSDGILGHDDILRMGPAMITDHPLMRRIVSDRFPYIFVDESQDTSANVVEAFRVLAGDFAASFCLGFFGDPMQKIYLTGIGAITKEEPWKSITKPENFRCPRMVLDVINRIRAEDDGLQQTRGRMTLVNGATVQMNGTARIFVLPADNLRTQRLQQVRTWLADTNSDPLWISDAAEGNVKMMVLVHRMAADRLGFPTLYAALNDNGSSLKDGLLDGSAWILRPFRQFILPLVRAKTTGREFDVIGLLRAGCPRLSADNVTKENARPTLDQLNHDIDELIVLMHAQGTTTRQVLTFINDRQLYVLDEKVSGRLAANGQADATDDDAAVIAFLACPVVQLSTYETYIEQQSPFETHQGVKGAEFDRVLVVLDDEEANYNLFSFGKYFGIAPLSATDQVNAAEGKDSVIERTRRLFYVCCSRALRDLAVVFFVPPASLEAARTAAARYFRAEDVHLVEDLPQL